MGEYNSELIYHAKSHECTLIKLVQVYRLQLRHSSSSICQTYVGHTSSTHQTGWMSG